MKTQYMALFPVLFCLFFLASSPVMAELQVGSPAPDFTLKDKDGKSYTLSDYRGKIILLNFIGHT